MDLKNTGYRQRVVLASGGPTPRQLSCPMTSQWNRSLRLKITAVWAGPQSETRINTVVLSGGSWNNASVLISQFPHPQKRRECEHCKVLKSCFFLRPTIRSLVLCFGQNCQCSFLCDVTRGWRCWGIDSCKNRDSCRYDSGSMCKLWKWIFMKVQRALLLVMLLRTRGRRPVVGRAASEMEIVLVSVVKAITSVSALSAN